MKSLFTRGGALFILATILQLNFVHATTCTGFRTQTQGGWGQEAHGGNAGSYRDAHFASAFPNGVTIGCGSNTLTLTSAQAVEDFLPSGTTPFLLPAGAMVNPGASYSNVFAGQLITAVLNVGFDLSDASFGSSSIHTQDLYYTSGTFAGYTVAQVIAEANSVIGGCSTTHTPGELNDALDQFNNNYDNGTTDQHHFDCTPSLSVQCSGIDGTCANGKVASASVAASGGYTPYHYSWSNGGTASSITNITGGTYTVTVTDDHGATATCSVSVSVIECCNVTDGGSISGDEAHCGSYDGSAIDNTNAASGGIGPVQYQWYISFDNFASSSIIIGATNDSYDPGTISQNTYFRRDSKNQGCSDYVGVSNIVKKTVYDIPQVTCSSENGNCSNGLIASASVDVSGGSQPYHYSWNNGETASSITNLAAGTYTVTVSDDHGCSASCTSTVDVVSCCNVTDGGEISGDEAHCGSYDGALISSSSAASGGVGAPVYNWLISFDNFATYSVINGATDDSYDPGTITQTTYFKRLSKNSSCNDYVGESNVAVKIIYDIPTAYCTPTNGDCHSDYLGKVCADATGGTEPYSYSWNNNGTDACISGLENGEYSVVVTDHHGCSATCSSVVTNATPLNIDETHIDVTANGGNDGSIDVTVTGGVGPYDYLWNDGNTSEDRTDLSAGTYSIVVTDVNGCTENKTILVNEPMCNCAIPAGIVVTPLINDEVQVCWDAQNCATGYILQFQWKGHKDWFTVDVTSPDHCATFSLTGHANINIKVATVCKDGDTTVYSTTMAYKYTSPCTPPSNLVTSNVTPTSVTFNWTPGTATTGQRVRYQQVHTQNAVVKTLSTTASLCTVNGLLPSTTYSWKVKGDCWSPSYKFTTAAQKEDLITSSNDIGELSVYPNPASNHFSVTIKLSDQEDQTVIIQLVNVMGQIVYSAQESVDSGNSTTNINLKNEFQNGVYILRVLFNNQSMEKRVIINSGK